MSIIKNRNTAGYLNIFYYFSYLLIQLYLINNIFKGRSKVF